MNDLFMTAAQNNIYVGIAISILYSESYKILNYPFWKYTC